jgi:hypothetical protein
MGLVFLGGCAPIPNMAKAKQDKRRDQRIEMEIVVDAYDPEERAMGWYCYLQDRLKFPFRSKCIAQRPISPLRKGEEVQVVDLAPEDQCQHEMFVTVTWENRPLAVPLAQLQVIKADKATQQAVEDWHYWVERGYEF